MNNSIDINIVNLKSIAHNSADFTVRELNLNDKYNTKAVLITTEGMCNKEGIALSIINPIICADFTNTSKEELYSYIKNYVLSASEIVEVDTYEKVMTFSMSGFAVLAIDGFKKMLAVGIQGFSFRGVSSPETEVIQRGPREGFVESIKINKNLIRNFRKIYK